MLGFCPWDCCLPTARWLTDPDLVFAFKDGVKGQETSGCISSSKKADNLPRLPILPTGFLSHRSRGHRWLKECQRKYLNFSSSSGRWSWGWGTWEVTPAKQGLSQVSFRLSRSRDNSSVIFGCSSVSPHNCYGARLSLCLSLCFVLSDRPRHTNTWNLVTWNLQTQWWISCWFCNSESTKRQTSSWTKITAKTFLSVRVKTGWDGLRLTPAVWPTPSLCFLFYLRTPRGHSC